LTAKPAPLPNPAKGFADLPPGRKDKGRRETSSASIVLCSSLTRPSICQLRTSAQQGNHAKHQPWHQPQGILRIKGSQIQILSSQALQLLQAQLSLPAAFCDSSNAKQL